jgi:hypothetical protein
MRRSVRGELAGFEVEGECRTWTTAACLGTVSMLYVIMCIPHSPCVLKMRTDWIILACYTLTLRHAAAGSYGMKALWASSSSTSVMVST